MLRKILTTMASFLKCRCVYCEQTDHMWAITTDPRGKRIFAPFAVRYCPMCGKKVDDGTR